MTEAPLDHLAAERAKILDDALPHVPFEGWAVRTLRLAAEDAGLDPSVAELAFPGGPVDAIEYWSTVSDVAMRIAYEKADTDAMRLREKITFLVHARIEAVADHREAVRRAITHMSRPPYARRGARALYRTVDDMWYAAGEIMEIGLDGVRRFGPKAEVYIRPILSADAGLGLLVLDPESTRFVLTGFNVPMPTGDGFSACIRPCHRPSPETALTNATASCHYPNCSRAMIDARNRRFQNPVMCDSLGHVAEIATPNIWIARDGVAISPVDNGSFQNGITRQHLISPMRADGIAVAERTVTVDDVRSADAIFNSSNYCKAQPVTKFEDRTLQPGPVYRRARELYWDFAHTR